MGGNGATKTGLKDKMLMGTNKKPGKWRKRTQAVRGGQVRSAFQETCEPLIFTAGYAYEAAEEAEARFKGESPGYQYSRIANPTVSSTYRQEPNRALADTT